MSPAIENPESKIENSASVLVSARLSGGTYRARAGTGKPAKTASCTSCGPNAALSAASKYFGVPEEQISLAKASPGVFKATVVATEGTK